MNNLEQMIKTVEKIMRDASKSERKSVALNLHNALNEKPINAPRAIEAITKLMNGAKSSRSILETLAADLKIAEPSGPSADLFFTAEPFRIKSPDAIAAFTVNAADQEEIKNCVTCDVPQCHREEVAQAEGCEEWRGDNGRSNKREEKSEKTIRESFIEAAARKMINDNCTCDMTGFVGPIDDISHIKINGKPIGEFLDAFPIEILADICRSGRSMSITEILGQAARIEKIEADKKSNQFGLGKSFAEIHGERAFPRMSVDFRKFNLGIKETMEQLGETLKYPQNLRPTNKFFTNTIEKQFLHMAEEMGEIAKALREGDLKHAAHESGDLQESAETLIHLLGFIGDQVRKEIVEKNKSKGYYIQKNINIFNHVAGQGMATGGIVSREQAEDKYFSRGVEGRNVDREEFRQPQMNINEEFIIKTMTEALRNNKGGLRSALRNSIY